SGPTAKELLPEVIAGSDPAALVAERGLSQVADEDQLGSLVDQVMVDNPDLVERVAVNPKAVNALLGAVMKASGGRAKPDLVRAPAAAFESMMPGLRRARRAHTGQSPRSSRQAFKLIARWPVPT